MKNIPLNSNDNRSTAPLDYSPARLGWWAGAAWTILGVNKVVVLAVAVLNLNSCTEASRADLAQAARALVEERVEPSPSPVEIVIACDSTTGTSCNANLLSNTQGKAFELISDRPGSTLRRFRIGSLASSGGLVGPSITTPQQPTAGGTKARQLAAGRFLTESQRLLNATADAALRESPGAERHILEGISAAAHAFTTKGERHLVLITRLRERSSIARLTCQVPAHERFLRALDRHDALRPSSLDGVHVHVAFFGPSPSDPIDGCDSPTKRDEAIRRVMTDALTRAGAASVAFTAGPPEFPKSDVTSPARAGATEVAP